MPKLDNLLQVEDATEQYRNHSKLASLMLAVIIVKEANYTMIAILAVQVGGFDCSIQPPHLMSRIPKYTVLGIP